jgi:hypothetical protein
VNSTEGQALGSRSSSACHRDLGSTLLGRALPSSAAREGIVHHSKCAKGVWKGVAAGGVCVNTTSSR